MRLLRHDRAVVPVLAVVAAVAASVLGLVVPVARPTSTRAAGVAALPAAVATAGRATVGPLFPGGQLAGPHTCTASVIDASTGDLILTAAHCVHGSGTGTVFAPGYRDGGTPFGTWKVTAAYADPAWLKSQDPHDDYAVLRVAALAGNRGTEALQRVTGGDVVAQPPPRDTRITIIGYNKGIGGSARRCRTTMYWSNGFPTFFCDGFVDGSSGSPWLSAGPSGRTAVIGVIGGPHHGGCLAFVSHSSDFRQDVMALVKRAVAGGRPDTMPNPTDDGC